MPYDVPDFGRVDYAPWLGICFHETGHWLMADALGTPVNRVHVSADLIGSGTSGFVEVIEPPLEEMTPDQVRHAQLISVAGVICASNALALYAHQDLDVATATGWSHCTGDRAMFFEESQYPGAIRFDTACTQAESILLARWDEVEVRAYSLADGRDH